MHDTGNSVPGRKSSRAMILASYKHSAARAGTKTTIRRHTTLTPRTTATTAARLFGTVLCSFVPYSQAGKVFGVSGLEACHVECLAAA